MEHIQDQLHARKRRLEQLSRRSQVNTEPQVAANSIENSIQNIESDQSSKEIYNDIISNSNKKLQRQEKSQDSLNCSVYAPTNMMKDALQDSLDELDRRTEEAIKKVVRRRLVSDALHDK